MTSGIYAIAHIGNLKLYVGECNKLSQKWPPILSQLHHGTYPHSLLQQAWNTEGDKRYFTFHIKEEIIGDPEIVGVEELLAEVAS
jgi:hypothetical protein